MTMRKGRQRLPSYRSIFRDLCGAQRDLAVKVEVIKELGFGLNWQRETKATRRKHMLEGHVRACSFLKGDATRIYSGDITLESLEKDNGGGFLGSLKTYILRIHCVF
jgi:hypothetical protein